MNTIEALSKSKFRSSFHLNDTMKEYIKRKGMDTIEKHAYDFIQERISPAYPKNDGKQTPMKGHPIFIAQHACACCCRSCLEKWHHIPMGHTLTQYQINHIVSFLMEWIKLEMKK